jgi:hypothetical protein
VFDRTVKSLLAGAIALAGALASGWDDSHLTHGEIALAIGAAIVAWAGAYALANVWAKAVVSAAVAGLATFATASADDRISAQEWITIVLAVLTALYAVYKVPNSDGQLPFERDKTHAV